MIMSKNYSECQLTSTQPIHLSDRKPKPEDCLEIKNSDHVMYYCWFACLILHANVERLIWDWKPLPYASERGWEQWTYWLPASTSFLPTKVEG